MRGSVSNLCMSFGTVPSGPLIICLLDGETRLMRGPIMFRLLWALSSRIYYFLRPFMPTNILIDMMVVRRC